MIGIIWAPDDKQCIEEAKRELEFIREGYLRQGYKIIKVSSMHFDCENQDTWKIVIANYNASRQHCNISYIHRQIGGDFIETVIKPQTLKPPYWSYNYYGTPSYYYHPEDEEESKADDELDEIKCPICGKSFHLYINTQDLTPWTIYCDNCNIDISCAHLKDGVRLLKDFIGMPQLHIEHYDDKIQLLSIDGAKIIDNENN